MSTRARTLRLVAAIACLVLLVFPSQAREPKEYQIKAAFLYNFTKFVEWPPQCFGAPEAPIVIGVIGRNPFGAELENVVRNRKINGRPVAIARVTTAAEARAVHVLFVAEGEEKRLVALAAHAPGVLTVGESDAFADAGGIVNFTVAGDKVRFEINVTSAEQAGLKLSSQLLKLAAVVRRKP